MKSHLVVGEINFEFLVVRPFSHPAMDSALGRTFSKSTRVIGHRGSGANNSNSGLFRRSHIKENTILSFVTAGTLGMWPVIFFLIFFFPSSFSLSRVVSLYPRPYHSLLLLSFSLCVPPPLPSSLSIAEL